MISGEKGGMIIFTEDRAVQMLSIEGNVIFAKHALFYLNVVSNICVSLIGKELWSREESLADVTSVEMIDLPVSAQEATMQEEFGQNDGTLILFVLNTILSSML